jgi:beta-galactosidase
MGKLFLLAAAALCALPALGASADANARTVIDFNPQWKFFAGDVPHAEEASLDDKAWTAIAVPHDWSIAGPVDAKNPSGQGGGFFPTGVAWYRKSFSLPTTAAHRRTYIAFDGVMANSDVWINGYHLGHRPNGFVSFYYDLTGHVQFGPESHNVLAVRCDTSRQPASRWYEGGGIYRPVRLVELDSVHLEPWSTVVTTPEISPDKATVAVRSTVINDSNAPQQVALKIVLTAPDGRLVGTLVTPVQTVAAGTQAHFSGQIAVTQPQIWDIAHPWLYRAHVSVHPATTAKGAPSLGMAHDDERVNFGIRAFHFDPETGFWLNGRNFKLKGAALHADGGAMGIAVPLSIWESRLTALRALGVNAIRTAHNPPSPEFLDLCDRMGFLVMDELFDCWTVGKNPYDYHLDFEQWSEMDARETVRRDRNHPSIILWSAGNEIHDTPNAELAHKILAKLIAIFHDKDSTRPVTQALFRPNVSHDYDNGLADMLDVVGQNYRENEILAAHAQKPSRAIVGTENTHDRNAWLALRDHAPYSGQFIWAGIDYLGESGTWPNISRPLGLLDRTGRPHARGWERQSWWADQPVVHMVRRMGATEKAAIDPGYESVPTNLREPLQADWTPRVSGPHTETVEVYTNCDEAELFLNGTSLGRQQLHADATPLTWSVAYAPGALKVVGYRHGSQVAEDLLQTAGKPARIVLSSERTKLALDRNDVVAVVATAVDDAGVAVPDASQLVRFSVSGSAQIVATDNGSVSEHASFQLPERRMYAGRAVVLVRATAAAGAIEIHASADGMKPGAYPMHATPSAKSETLRSF